MSQPMYLGIYEKMYTCINVFTCAHIASDQTNNNNNNNNIETNKTTQGGVRPVKRKSNPKCRRNPEMNPVNFNNLISPLCQMSLRSTC